MRSCLPVRLSSLGIVKPTKLSTSELLASINTSAQLSDLILKQSHEYFMAALNQCQEGYLQAKLWQCKDICNHTENNLTCACGTNFSVEHALSCPKGSFPTVRHNEVRDLVTNLMSEVFCHYVCIDPTLQPITGEALSCALAITEDGARLDITASGFWEGALSMPSLPWEYSTPMPHLTDNPSPPVTENMRNQETSLRTKSSRSWAWLLNPPCHVSHWRSRKRCHSLLQEARLIAILQMGPALQQYYHLDQM